MANDNEKLAVLLSRGENYIPLSFYILYTCVYVYIDIYIYSLVFGALGNRKMLLIFIHIPGGCRWVDVQFSVCTCVCMFAYESRG